MPSTSTSHAAIPSPRESRARPGVFALSLLLGVSCAHILQLKTSREDAATYASVEDFIQENFTIGIRELGDALPTGKPKHVLGHGFIRYQTVMCEGVLSQLEKPSADLETYCTAKGGTFRRVADDPHAAGPLRESGYVGEYECNLPNGQGWSGGVCLEATAPGSPCVQVLLLVEGKTRPFAGSGNDAAPSCRAAVARAKTSLGRWPAP